MCINHVGRHLGNILMQNLSWVYEIHKTMMAMLLVSWKSIIYCSATVSVPICTSRNSYVKYQVGNGILQNG
ncbi:hypothetical protein X975_18925, partial [Stegodyphus mimosarum]